jgi:hypothetical protein
MRKEKKQKLMGLLRGLAELVNAETDINPEFAAKVENLLSESPKHKTVSKKSTITPPENLPDIYLEWDTRGETDFRFWLREQPVSVLRTFIRIQDFDSIGRTSKWKEQEKLAEFIADGMRARLSRGSAFMKSNVSES